MMQQQQQQQQQQKPTTTQRTTKATKTYTQMLNTAPGKKEEGFLRFISILNKTYLK